MCRFEKDPTEFGINMVNHKLVWLLFKPALQKRRQLKSIREQQRR